MAEHRFSTDAPASVWEAVNPKGEVVGVWVEGYRGYTPDHIRGFMKEWHPGCHLRVTRFTAVTTPDDGGA